MVAKMVRSAVRVPVRPLAPSLGVRPGRKFDRPKPLNDRHQGLGFQHHSRRPRRGPVGWGSSSVALPMCGLADVPPGERCFTSHAFSHHAVFPSSLSGEGVRASTCAPVRWCFIHTLPVELTSVSRTIFTSHGARLRPPFRPARNLRRHDRPLRRALLRPPDRATPAGCPTQLPEKL
jgi:hypothetical protein